MSVNGLKIKTHTEPRQKDIMHKKGFSLIELMIVIAIIGLLAAIAVPAFISYRDKSFCSAAENDAQNIKAAISCYFAEADNTTLNDISLLQLGADQVCTVTLSGLNTGEIEFVSTTYWHIEVVDGSTRCPRSNIYHTYMGTNLQSSWSP